MAYDGYRGTSINGDQHQPQYSSSYDSRDGINGGYYSQAYSQYPPDLPRSRSRASSTARSDTSQPQPIYAAAKAVNSAFDSSTAASQVDPALIAQITEQVRRQVIDSLKESGISSIVNEPRKKTPPPPQTAIPRSPTSTTAGTFPTRNVYTPPSPTKSDFPAQSPQSPISNISESLDGSKETPKPEKTRATSTASSTRPPPVAQESEDGDATVVEKMWRQLFDTEGQPTARLGQFLRGLAIHLIEDWEPKNSIVLTPTKMLKFYETFKLPEEVYPWSTVFKLSNGTISKLYRDLRCEHHFIQDQPDKMPHIPALTPNGFQVYMTALIQAYPEAEFQRLAKAVINLPISNADDVKERFPKELSRRLFPKAENLQAQQRCAVALSCDGRIPVPRSTTFPPPPPPPVQPQPSGSNLERERSPYGGASGPERQGSMNAAVDDDQRSDPVSIPIERERKPYIAKEGSGKIYEDNNPIPSSGHRHQRSQSTTSQPSSWMPGGPRPSISVPPGEYPPPPGTNRLYRSDTNRTTRTRSPSFGSNSAYGTRSDGNIGDIPASYYQSNINMYDDEENRKYAQNTARDAHRRQAEEAYNLGQRSIYDDEQHYRGRGSTISNGYGVPHGYSTSQPKKY